jgi:hypothetical protein
MRVNLMPQIPFDKQCLIRIETDQIREMVALRQT